MTETRTSPAMAADEYFRRIANGARQIAQMADHPEPGLATWMTAMGERIEDFHRFATIWPYADDARYR